MTEWTQPYARDLLIAVRDIVAEHPERWNQRQWVGNVFTSPSGGKVEDLAPFAMSPLPEEPLNEDNPVCGTRACVAGWAAILGSPPGTVIDGNGDMMIPGEINDDIMSAMRRARDVLGLDENQADYLFDAYRTHQEVLDALGALLDDPDALLDDPSAPIWRTTVTYKVTVTDEHGNEVWTHDAEVERDDSRWGRVETAVIDARNNH
jgi:hypothetical protein